MRQAAKCRVPRRAALIPAALAGLLGLGLLAGCEQPPPSAFFGGSSTTAGTGTGLGKNAAGEDCTAQSRGGGSASDIFCGTWTQPSAHIERGQAADAAALPGLATDSTWRAALNSRYVCSAPSATTILGAIPAVVMQCTRKVGGWPQLAMAASVDGTAYLADGILPSLPVMERGIGVMAGKVSATASSALPRSQADALFAARLAAQAFTAGDVGQYDQLMLAGTRANLAEDFVRSEDAYRAALAVQEKALGQNDPNVADPLMHVALQLSDQGRYSEAAAQFARAASLAARSNDPVIAARLLHYEALDAVNQNKDEVALGLLRRAESAYAALLPPGALAVRASHVRPIATLAASGGATRQDPLPKAEVILDPAQQAGLIGLIETHRYQSIVLRDLGKPEDATTALSAAVNLAATHGLTQPDLAARLYRTAASNDSAQGNNSDAATGLGRSTADFALALPGTRPLAETRLLRAAQLHSLGEDDEALAECREAAVTLRDIKAGTAPELLEPCLVVTAAIAEREPAQRQQLFGEMFDLDQLAQGSITAQQIAQASARLGENARDPKVGEAIRRRQDAGQKLADLYRTRDELAARARGETTTIVAALPTADELEKQIHDAQAALADADAALQAASPNFGQLVQQVAPAADVLAALQPDEAFALITPGDNGGWTFVLRDGQITAVHTDGSLKKVTDLVRAVRAGIEETDKGVPRFNTDAAHALYVDTLGPAEAAMAGAKSLIVAPTGPLLSLPFAVLLTGPGDPDKLGAAPFLIRRLAITHVPAAANFVSLRKVAASSRASQPWFGLGDFVPISLAQAQKSFPGSTCRDSAQLFAGLPRLPYARRELDAARQLLGGSAADEMVGQAFTVPGVLKADLRNFKVVHFAAHALLPSELRCESEPAIITSDPTGAPDASGALLTASKVSTMNLDADVVVLSACNSGGPGGETGGESLSGLARSFFYAGARALMVTHWSVNDQTTAFIVASTMDRLRKGEGGGVAGALRGAELAMLTGAGDKLPAEVAHPFYWAPFAVIGEGRSRIEKVQAGLPAPSGG
jgi:CHAT domain-containing protein